MYKDKRALVETLRKYKKHILGPLFTDAADAIDELLTENQQLLEAHDACLIEPQEGHWEFVIVDDADIFFRRRYVCSVCQKWQTYGKTAFCPSCGARMLTGENK